MSDDAAIEELQFLTRALRAHLEWQAMTGTTGLERAPRGAVEAAVSVAPMAMTDVGLDRAARAGAEVAPIAPLAASAQASSARLAEPTTSAPSDAARRLQVLAESVRGCTRCGLARERKQTVFARGTGSSGLCFVGEGPGADEDEQGLPFVGKAGQLLDRMIAAMGLESDEVYICNVVKCRPPGNRKPEPDEMAACMPYLHEQLGLVAPRIIVALGATALEGFFGPCNPGEGITRLRGKWRKYGDVPVMPTFHPSYLLRTPAAKREVWEDLQEVLRRMGRSLPPRRA